LNILTKICIIVLVPLILVAATVFVAVLVIPSNYRHELDRQRSVNAALEEQNRRLKDMLRAGQDQLAASVDEGNRLKAQLAESKTEKREMWGKVVDNQTTLLAGIDKVDKREADFTRAHEFYAQRTEKLWAENRELRIEYTKLAENNVKLKDDLNQSKAEVARLDSKVKLLEEQLQDRDVQIGELNQRIDELQDELIKQRAATPRVVMQPGAIGGQGGAELVQPITIVGAGPAKAATIVGKIVAVRNDIASINVGKAHGVTVGMKMVITKNTRFVGYLQIEEVDASEAAGIVKDKQAEPQVGDQVSYPPPAGTD